MTARFNKAWNESKERLIRLSTMKLLDDTRFVPVRPHINTKQVATATIREILLSKGASAK